MRLRGKDIGLTDDASATKIHNDNQGCVDWCKTTTTSGMKHLDLRGNAVPINSSHSRSHQLC